MKTSFADFCRTLRKRKGLSQKQLAEKAALSLRTVVYWETGVREPRSEELQRTLRVLGATASELEHAYLLQTTQRGITLARRQMNENTVADSRDDLMPDLGDLLMMIRIRRGWSSEQLAQQMNVNRSTIVRWERTEQLPTEENLNRLCTLMEVYPAERHALFTRRLLPPMWQQQTSLDSCIHRIHRFCDSVDELHTPLVDLHALTLKREIYLTARNSPHFAMLIAKVETYHGKWLQLQDRISEATACAERALKLLAGQQSACDFLHTALNLASYCAGAKQIDGPDFGTKQVDGPKRSLRLLHQWQSIVSQMDVRFLLCCDMSYYAAQAEHHDAAMQLLRGAQRVMAVTSSPESSFSYYNTTYARVLAYASRPYEALNLMPEAPNPGFQDLFYSYVRAGMFLDAGEHDEAQGRIDTIYSKLKRYPSRLLQQRTDQLAARL